VKTIILVSAGLLIFLGLAPVLCAQSPHKLQLRDAAAEKIVTDAGGKLIADYGGFQLYQSPATPTNLPANEVEARDEYNFILLNATNLDTSRAEIQSLRKAAGPFAGKQLHLVQFAGPVQSAWRQALLGAGVQIADYIPQNTYLVYGDSTSIARVQTMSASAPQVQWDGAYLDEYKIHPAARAAAKGRDQYAIQLISDAAANAVTLKLIDQLKLAPVQSQRYVLRFLDVIVRLSFADLAKIAARPDVISIQPHVTPRKLCERQDQIVAGNISGTAPTGPGYLAWLEGKGFSQAQFDTSGFAVDVSDSGIDDGTTTPNHFGLYANGEIGGASRVIYNRLEGTPNYPGSTLKGCDGHGNLNAHIVGGYDNSSGVGVFEDSSGYHFGLGVCPFVRLGSSVVFDPDEFTSPNYADLISQAYQDGARVSNNSWGDDNPGEPAFYSLECQEYDALVRDAQPAGSAYPADGNQEMTIVFAAGNEGPAAGTVSAPGTAKNIISVGAADNVQPFTVTGSDGGADGSGITNSQADNANEIVFFSSRGPCTDGRQKPDLVAPGTHVSGGVIQAPNPGPDGTADTCFLDAGTNIGVSGGTDGSLFYPDTFPPAAGQQFYTASSGTSHSTPCISGGCALVRQYFINNDLTPPSPAMTKAYLMNSARYLNGSGADDTLWSPSQGMGEMNLGVAFDGTPRFLRDEVPADIFTASGQTRTFPGVIAEPAKAFRVTVAWTDAPGSTTGNAYNNDLDLTVTVGGKTYKGNVFSGSTSVTGGSADPRNNVESVFLPDGVSGPYTVTITAANINSIGVPNAADEPNQDFALVVYNSGAAPVLAAAGSALVSQTCSNGVINPGENVTVSLTLQNVGSLSTTNLVATLLATDGIFSPSAAQTFGAIAPGASNSATFSFVSGGDCGGSLTATLQLQDGSANLGNINYNFPLGALVTSTNYSENVDVGVAPPALPAGWASTDTSGGKAGWTTESGVSDTGPNAFFCPDSAFVDEVTLTSPSMTLPDGPSQLSFHQEFNLEDTGDGAFDGGVLDIRIGNGAFQDIVTAGGSFMTGGYTEEIERCAGGACDTVGEEDPLVGREAWSGQSDDFLTTVVNLPPSAEGKTIQLAWICGTDAANDLLVGVAGWWIDSIAIIQTNFSCCSPSASVVPAPTILFPPDGFSTNTTAVTVRGTGITGATVTVYDGTTSLGDATVKSGVFSLRVKLAGGIQDLTAMQTQNGLPSPASLPVTIDVILAPIITLQPQSQEGFLKGTAKFSAAAYGAPPLRYAWEKNGRKIPGAVSPNLTLPGLSANSAGDYMLTVANGDGSTNSAQVTLTLVPNPFTNVTGAFYGLFSQTPAQFQSSGFLTLTLNSLGAFTARILNAGGSYGFSGSFSVEGLQFQQNLPRAGETPLTLDWTLDPVGNQITGSVSSTAGISSLQANRAGSFPAPGRYTMIFAGTNEDTAASPGGDGYAAIDISPTGVASLTGVLSDNTSVAPSAVRLPANGQWPLYIPLYGKLGSLSGWIDFTNGGWAGNAAWFRGGPYGKLYRAGFTNTVSIIGMPFTNGNAHTPALDLTNLEVTLTNGDLGANSYSDAVTLYNSGRLATNSGDIPRLTLSVNPSTGVISGSFRDPASGLPTLIKGVLLQPTNGAGFFVTPNSANPTGILLLTPP
jgi:hypothetical protein